MGPKVDYEKDNVETSNETLANVTYDVHGGKQTFQDRRCTKGVEKRCLTKYKTGAGMRRSRSRSASGRTSVSVSTTVESATASKSRCGAGKGASSPSRTASCGKSNQQQHGHRPSCGESVRRTRSRVALSAKCYDVKRGKRPDPCNRLPLWQHGKYVEDECGQGIVPTRYDFKPSREIWCKTPLTMYQATIGDLARKILCREKIVPRDVKPAPPCNIEEYILPLCRGYYRKYDCLRPCEEDYAYYKGGQKHYRDRVERYWEPCYSKVQKIKLDINEYAPHNAYLAKRMLRRNNDLPCW